VTVTFLRRDVMVAPSGKIVRCTTVFFALSLVLAVAVALLLPPTIQLRQAPTSSTLNMSAVSYRRHGASASSVLEFSRDCPAPVPLDHQILVAVRWAALNPCDFKFRRATALPSPLANWLFPKPQIPGADLSGVVVAVGSAVRGFVVGDRVAAMLPLMGSRWGALAQLVAVDEAHAALVPDNVTLEHAAAVPLVGLTVVQAVATLESPTDASRTRRALVQAGAGGVGTFAIQWLNGVLGIEVSATASARNHALLRDLGAHGTLVDYTTTQFDEVLKDMDVVLDTMSFRHEVRTLAGGVMADDGHYLNIASSDWATASDGSERGNGFATAANVMHFGLCATLRRAGFDRFCRSRMRYSFVFVQPSGLDLAAILAELSAGRVRAVIDENRFKLEDTAAAYSYLERGHARGKVLVEIKPIEY